MTERKLDSEAPLHKKMSDSGHYSRFDINAQMALDGELGKYVPRGQPRLIKGLKINPNEIAAPTEISTEIVETIEIASSI